MLPKKNRAEKKSVERVFKEGKFINSGHLTFKFLNTGTQEKKISFIVPKNVAKLAVQRNLLRRLGYFLLKKYFPNFPLGTLGVFVFKKYPKDISMLENEIKNILSKIN